MPTVTSRIPQTEQYRRTRDAWADSQMGRLNKELGSAIGREKVEGATEADFREASRIRSRRRAWEKQDGITAAGDLEQQGVPQMTWTTGRKLTVTGKPPLEVTGIGQALDAITDPFMRAAIAEMDTAVGEAALTIWRDWPAWSGRSKSALALAWGTGSAGIEIRFISGADYTFRTSPTARAWAVARRVWNQVPAQAGERLRATRV